MLLGRRIAKMSLEIEKMQVRSKLILAFGQSKKYNLKIKVRPDPRSVFFREKKTDLQFNRSLSSDGVRQQTGYLGVPIRSENYISGVFTCCVTLPDSILTSPTLFMTKIQETSCEINSIRSKSL